MSHWYQEPPSLCVECGQPWNHENHKRRCRGTYSGFGAGFAFCQLEEGHDGPHLLTTWDGSQWLVDGATYTKVMGSTRFGADE